MKSLKNKLMIAVVAMFIVGGSVVTTNVYAVEEPPCMESADGGGCGYKKKECLFKPDQKCTGSGRDCGVSDPCGNAY